MQRICVYCGSSPGLDPEYSRAARQLGRALAGEGITLVYGGGDMGLMGDLARAAIDGGGQVIGVVPRKMVETLNMELAFGRKVDVRVVDSMHERKALMADLADGFIALPGGLGTFEEVLEALTWAQLGIHRKPCGLLNTLGYYDRLLGFLDHAVSQGFLAQDHRNLTRVSDVPQVLLGMLRDYRPDGESKANWIRRMAESRVDSEDRSHWLNH